VALAVKEEATKLNLEVTPSHYAYLDDGPRPANDVVNLIICAMVSPAVLLRTSRATAD
jgi:hypothetical protein